MVNIEITLVSLDTLLVTLHSKSDRMLPCRASDTAHQTRLGALRRAYSREGVDNLLVVLASEFSTESLRNLATWFPRRLNGGRVGVVCQTPSKVRAFASTLTVPLLPRPVRVFSSVEALDALSWVLTGNARVPRLETTTLSNSIAGSSMPQFNFPHAPNSDWAPVIVS